MKNLSFCLLAIASLVSCAERDSVLYDVSNNVELDGGALSKSMESLLYVRPLTIDEKEAYKELFPYLDVDRVSVLDEYSDDYNCIAYAMGIENLWISPEANLEDFKSQFENAKVLYGSPLPKLYEGECQGGNAVVDGWGMFGPFMTHASRLFGSEWRSKLGHGPLITHNRFGLSGDIYGNVLISFTYARPKYSALYSKIDTTRVELTKLEHKIVSGYAQKVNSDVRDEFERLHSEWYDASKKDLKILFSSSMYSRMEVPQFKELLAMGDEILPLVIEKMMDRKYFFTQVLYEALMEGRRVLDDETVIRSAQDRAQLLVREWIWVGRGKMSQQSL